jgi:hypothetical protein
MKGKPHVHVGKEYFSYEGPNVDMLINTLAVYDGAKNKGMYNVH